MRELWLWLGSAAILAPAAANAADQLKFGPPPAWVVPQVIPPASTKSPDAPVAILLTDQQIRFEPGKTVTYGELAMKLQTAEGLAAGNLSIPWDPATDTVTINKLQIRRGNQIIDVLASQSFTTIRRESNLELAMFDGVLTGSIQPEGLQQGDEIDLATTTERVDPVFGSHVEGNFMQLGGSTIQLAHLHLDWPNSLPLKVQAKGVSVTWMERAGRNVVELSQRDVQPIVPPKGAPARFNITRFGEATDFASWADLAALMAPLYAKAETILAAGPLHDEVEKIRAASADPKRRAEMALRLVQDRVRYVALLMGQGGYVPASAETSWSRRFGDCKAKTALLLGILHSLGIEAEPIIVQSQVGDAIPERLPLVSYFDHVLVRAHVAGKTYFLDGTRTEDGDLDAIEVPNFDWGLPLVNGAKLVAMAPPPRQVPSEERHVDVDASAGVYAPAQITITEISRGDGAIALNQVYAALTGPQKDELVRRQAVEFFEGMQVASSSLQLDRAKREFTMIIKGTAKLNWKDRWLYVPTSSIGFTPDFDRPEGPLHDSPIAVSHPRFASDVATFKLPPGFAAQQKLDPTVRETLAGVEYARAESVSGDTLKVVSSERSLVSEVPYKEALASAARLKAINEDDTYLRVPDAYRATTQDIAALSPANSDNAGELVNAGYLLMDAWKFDEAIADFTKALTLDPHNARALANRGLSYVWTKKYDLAAKDLEAAAAIEPDNVVVQRARGLQAQFTVDCKSAVEAFSKALKVEPQDSFSLGHRAICENEIGQYSEAIADAERTLTLDSKWQDMHAVRLDSFARLGQRDAAFREAEVLAAQDHQTTAAAWIRIASLFASAGLPNEAVACFDKALAIKQEASTYVARAAVRPADDIKGRMADIDAALKVEPMSIEALQAKGDLLAEQGDLKSALSVLDDAQKQVKGQSPLSVSRGILLYRLGRKAEGQRILDDWRRGALTATELNSLCWKKATAGILLESALKDCTDALRINPDYAPAIDSLAFVKLRLGKLNEAAGLYDRALKISPMAASYLGRALAYRGLGDKDKAQADRSAAMRQDVRIESRFASYGLKFEDGAETASPRAH